MSVSLDIPGTLHVLRPVDSLTGLGDSISLFLSPQHAVKFGLKSEVPGVAGDANTLNVAPSVILL